VPNHLTIRLNRLIERKYKRTTNERTMVTVQNLHLTGPKDAGTAVRQEGSKWVEGNGNLEKNKKLLPIMLAFVKQQCW